MSMIFVSPDFPLNRRMRKAVQRGKLQVFREGGERSAVGGGMANGLIPPFRTFSSSLVCFASREGDSGATGGGDGKPLPQYVDHAREYLRKAEEAARLDKRNEDTFMRHFIFAYECKPGYRHGPEDIPHSFYLSRCDSDGREEVHKRIWDALVFFLGCFREDAESVCEQLKNAKIKVGDYPRQYEKLEKTQRSLVESVDKKLLGLELLRPREGARAHQSYIEPILKFMGHTIPKGLADDNYSYYNSPEAKEVKKIGEEIEKKRQERVFTEKRKRAETERQRDEVWGDSSMKMFPANLGRADVLAARNIVGKELEDSILVKVVSELLTDNEFWDKIARPSTDEGQIVRYDLPGQFWSDPHGKIASPGEVKTRILEHSAKEAARDDFFFRRFGKSNRVGLGLGVGLDLNASPEKLEKARNKNRPSAEEIIACAKRGISISIPRKLSSRDLDGLGDLFSHGVSEVFEGWKTNQYHFNWGEMEDLYRDLEKSGYFTPDDWVSNLREIPPVVKGPWEFQEPVRLRLEEIRRSYFFGNWLSVISLSRCLMEYVLIQTLGKDAESGRKDINGGYKPLGTLIAEMSEQMRELQMDMESIQKTGNYTMHPRYESGDILSRRKQDAQDCLRGIVRIVSILGGKETTPTLVPPVKQRKRPAVKKTR